MTSGQTSGARALQLEKLIRGYLNSTNVRPHASELQPSNLSKLLQEVFRLSREAPDSRIRHEAREIYCQGRDLVYLRRNRRWLMSRGFQGHAHASDEAWLRFVRGNNGTDLKKLTGMTVEELASEPFTTTMRKGDNNAWNAD